ncbi:hypothetical protein D0865_06971 [Hortaea werneckii]|uniref:Uncharacterized protein n=1 Tax=Hortaea werneckii TaxID=91943 RepID=A0A3M7CER3_HORWE|nr:hypothetical protein D0865_06971 [Hortaea werneckii]
MPKNHSIILWKAFPGSVVPKAAGSKLLAWLRGKNPENMTQLATKMNKARQEANAGRFVYYRAIHHLFKHMMSFGCIVVDSFFLPTWIEASPEGNLLDKSFGSYVLEMKHEKDLGDYANMRRNPRALQYSSRKL